MKKQYRLLCEKSGHHVHVIYMRIVCGDKTLCYIFILLGQVKGSLEVISQVLGLKGFGKNRLVNKCKLSEA